MRSSHEQLKCRIEARACAGADCDYELWLAEAKASYGSKNLESGDTIVCLANDTAVATRTDTNLGKEVCRLWVELLWGSVCCHLLPCSGCPPLPSHMLALMDLLQSGCCPLAWTKEARSLIAGMCEDDQIKVHILQKKKGDRSWAIVFRKVRAAGILGGGPAS